MPGPKVIAARRQHSLRNRRAVAEAELKARRAIGDAIIKGERATIAAAYLALARLMIETGHLRSAATELEEALDVVCLCATASPCPLTDTTAEILLALLPLYLELGDHAAAARTRAMLDRSTTLTMARP
jgi:hypothetical protein